jgi:hypothetical protein
MVTTHMYIVCTKALSCLSPYILNSFIFKSDPRSELITSNHNINSKGDDP